MNLKFLLVLGGALLVSRHAATAAPAQAPKLAPAIAYAPDKSSELYNLFNRLPDYVFRYFGSTNRHKLINNDRVTFDKANSYIEIPIIGGRSNHPDREQLQSFQMKVLRDSDGRRVVLVATSVRSQLKVKPFLHVFRFDKDGHLVRTTAKDFPYPLYSEIVDGSRMPYNYYLPNIGNIIVSVLPDSAGYRDSYRWTGQRFVRFTPKIEEI